MKSRDELILSSLKVAELEATKRFLKNPRVQPLSDWVSLSYLYLCVAATDYTTGIGRFRSYARYIIRKRFIDWIRAHTFSGQVHNYNRRFGVKLLLPYMEPYDAKIHDVCESSDAERILSNLETEIEIDRIVSSELDFKKKNKVVKKRGPYGDYKPRKQK